MVKRVSAAQAKAHFSELVAQVAYGGQRIIIERRGQPLAALVSLADLTRVQRQEEVAPRGALALVGAWSDLLEDGELDALVADIYEQRARDIARPVPIPE